METEGRRRSGGSAKTPKKGGKRVKTLSAEEEERRRQMLKEKLREKLELEKRALKIVERLLEDSVPEDFLMDCAKFITPANYKDVIEERFITKLCGYPICPNKLGKIPTQQYKISTKTNKVYDITERKCFCSNFCYKASREFELQISTTPLWLRQHESPPEIRLMKKGDGGSSGEEVMLSERRLREEDIEKPLDTQAEDPQRRLSAASLSHSESSDAEQEQDFVSSVVSQRQGPRVHWGDLPKRTDEDEGGEQRKMERRMNERREGNEVEVVGLQDDKSWEFGTDTETPEKLHSLNTDKPNGLQVPEEKGWSEEASVEEATAKLKLCSLSETVTDAAPQAEPQHLPSSTLSNSSLNNHSTALTSQPGLNITQVGMSKRGAAGLRDLLKNHTAGPKPESLRLNLLECLRRTLKDWSTDETLTFLYGTHRSQGSLFADTKEEGKEEEELDEDDLEDEVTREDAEEVQERTCAAAPDFQTLQKESQQLEVRVREFYKGTWILPKEEEEPRGNKDRSTKDPVLPLVDFNAQHIIQKRIVVEKLTSCLKKIVGPLRLTMSDVSTDLNNLVRTFRFTNTNIIHKTPEWTLIAVVLLHLLSEVSPVVREALETQTSAEYLNTLMEELSLQEQDLLNLVRLLKTPAP